MPHVARPEKRPAESVTGKAMTEEENYKTLINRGIDFEWLGGIGVIRFDAIVMNRIDAIAIILIESNMCNPIDSIVSNLIDANAFILIESIAVNLIESNAIISIDSNVISLFASITFNLIDAKRTPRSTSSGENQCPGIRANAVRHAAVRQRDQRASDEPHRPCPAAQYEAYHHERKTVPSDRDCSDRDILFRAAGCPADIYSSIPLKFPLHSSAEPPDRFLPE